jgi:mevalonate kinase
VSTASAPGKIILFGEHAVVYGQPAIAVPVAEVAAMATVDPAPSGAGFRVIAADLQRDYHLVDAPAGDPLAAIVRAALAELGQSAAPDATLVVSSTIPLGRGLGSGAAISTAIARAVARYGGVELSSPQISALVYEVEKLYHGTPSGIDNTVVAFEQPVYFIRGRPIQRLRVARPFTVVIGDTGITASTRDVVGHLRQRWQAEPERYGGYFDEIGAIAQQARMIIQEKVFPIAALGKLMDENQEVLVTLGVSSPELDRLVKAARQAGAWGAKLSGAGWGGNMIALAPPEPDGLKAVEAALLAAGAANVITSQIS